MKLANRLPKRVRRLGGRVRNRLRRDASRARNRLRRDAVRGRSVVRRRALRLMPHERASRDHVYFRVDDVNPIVIPDSVALERRPPKAITKVYDGPLERFDYKTLFYDAVLVRGRQYPHIRLIGPPLANLTSYVRSSQFFVDDTDVSRKVTLGDLTRKQISHIAHRRGKRLRLKTPDFTADVPITRADGVTFQGRNVLLTINKDNNLVWVKDWVTYYVKAHGIDAVVIYDTGSTTYSPDELLATLHSVDGVKAAVVVRWPFRHGPFRERPGVGSEANFSQVAMLAHAKRKYLWDARAVVACDVDELIYSYEGTSICEAVVAHPKHIISIPGTWVESVTTTTELPHRHLDFAHVLPEMPDCAPKWAIAPSKLDQKGDWQVHGVYKKGPQEPSTEFHFGHFRGINTNWREKDRASYAPPTDAQIEFLDIAKYIAPNFPEYPARG